MSLSWWTALIKTCCVFVCDGLHNTASKSSCFNSLHPDSEVTVGNKTLSCNESGAVYYDSSEEYTDDHQR